MANYIPDGSVSMAAFARCLQKEYAQRGLEVRLCAPGIYLGRLGLGPLRKWFGYFDKFIIARKQIARIAQDIPVHSVFHILDQAGAIYLDFLQKVPHLVTCNDLLAIRSAKGEIPEHKTRWSGRQLQKRILTGLKNAKRVACISETTRQDFLRITNLPAKFVSVNYMGLNYPYKPVNGHEISSRLNQFNLFPDDRFILHVGGTQWYKNRRFVIQTFSLLASRKSDLKLVLAGQPLTPEESELIKMAGLEHRVVSASGCSNADLEALYSCAFCLFFPSLYEGLGWPVIEAQACACPVVTSNRAPMTEIGAHGAIYIDPADTESAAQGIISLSCQTRRNELVSAGLSNVSRFSTAGMVESYLSLYQEVTSPAKQSVELA